MTREDYVARVKEFAEVLDVTREFLAVENIYEVFSCALLDDLRVAIGISDEDDEAIWNEIFSDSEEE